MDYKKELKKMYAEVFSSNRCMFCQTKEYDCSEFCNVDNDSIKFSFDMAAKVGNKYENEDKKILIIGKESKEKHIDVGTPSSLKDDKNQHWLRTYNIVECILHGDNVIRKYNGYGIADNNDIDDWHNKIALTNFYHCAKIKKGNMAHGLYATNDMWYNCANIVKKEIEILNPDIILYQAGWATKKHNKVIPDLKPFIPDNDISCISNIDGLFYANNINTYIVCSYHPSYNMWHKTPLDALKVRIKVLREKLKIEN